MNAQASIIDQMHLNMRAFRVALMPLVPDLRFILESFCGWLQCLLIRLAVFKRLLPSERPVRWKPFRFQFRP